MAVNSTNWFWRYANPSMWAQASIPCRSSPACGVNRPAAAAFFGNAKADDVFFGASPERLLSLRGGFLRSDALAGTAGPGDDGQQLLRSDKDRREHELVVETITDQLRQSGLSPWRRSQPQLARHGRLTHLHTPITAAAQGKSVLALAEQLHPTPAVAGLPRREAMAWLRTLEPFERGQLRRTDRLDR
jgi:menaquinone-specific isochorismate synthase